MKTKTSQRGKTASAAGHSRSRLQRVVRCCATCADWNPTRMECRYEQNEAAPPEYSCEGWRENLNPNSHWKQYAEKAAPNARMSEPPTRDAQ